MPGYAPTPAQDRALAIARHLAECGVPIFLAVADPSASTGYRLPKEWQRTEAEPSVLDSWRPGMAVCAVMGHLIDAIDIDPRNGGDESFRLLQQEGILPKSHGRQTTPSGGTHELIAALDVSSKSGVLPGVDLKAGTAKGVGRGFVFLAPTIRESKTTARPTAYEWVADPDLSSLHLLEDDDSGAAFREFVTQPPSSMPSTHYEGPSFSELAPGERAWALRDLERFQTHWTGVLVKAADWDESVRDAKGRGWESLSYQLAWSVAMYAAAPWSALDGELAGDLYRELLPTEIATDASCANKWTDGLLAKAATRPVALPPWNDDLGAADDNSKGKGSRASKLPVLLRYYIEDIYDVFPAADDGRIFAVPKEGGRAALVTGPFVMRATKGRLGDAAANLSTSASEASKVLSAYATVNAPRELALRVHYRPGRIVLDLAQRDNTRCVVVTPDGWEVHEVPPIDVTFQSSAASLPDPERGGSIEELREFFNWTIDDPRWPLIKGWLPAILLADRPRPMMGIFGPQGSAKSTTARFMVGVLDPKPAGKLGGGFGKSRSDDETKALKSYIPAWDNVSTLSSEHADLLSRLVTGDLIEKRQLYTDAELISIHYRRTGIITGITVPRGLKPDTLDRLILLHVQPLAGPRLSEASLDAKWSQVQPRVLAGTLDLAVTMLGRLDAARGSNREGLRMADYVEALWAVDPQLSEAYAENVFNARADMAEEDQFVGSILAWLRDRDGHFEGTAEEARFAAEFYTVHGQWWPKNAKAFSDQVTRAAELLTAAGVEITERRSNGRRLKRFALITNAGKAE